MGENRCGRRVDAKSAAATPVAAHAASPKVARRRYVRVITSPDGDIVEDRVAAGAGSYGATAPLSSGTWLIQLAALRPGW